MGISRAVAIAPRFWTATDNPLSSLVKSAIENLVYAALLIAPGPDVSTRAARRASSFGPNCPIGMRRGLRENSCPTHNASR